MWKSVFVQRTLPLTASYLLLIIAAISLDYLLHIAHLAWIGRYMGFAGTAFLVFSFAYSVRKKKLVRTGTLKFFLWLHCKTRVDRYLDDSHSFRNPFHFNAMLPWAATAFMLIVTASGHVGQYLLKQVREEVKIKMKQLGLEVTEDILERQHYWDILTLKTLEQWRTLHIPMVSVLMALTLIHILSITFFLNWR
ncbi:MAG: hypothetical protein WCG19_05980 [Chlorobiaceae bacterium]